MARAIIAILSIIVVTCISAVILVQHSRRESAESTYRWDASKCYNDSVPLRESDNNLLAYERQIETWRAKYVPVGGRVPFVPHFPNCRWRFTDAITASRYFEQAADNGRALLNADTKKKEAVLEARRYPVPRLLIIGGVVMLGVLILGVIAAMAWTPEGTYREFYIPLQSGWSRRRYWGRPED